MASYRYERDITPGDLAPRREKQYTRRERWANWWDYNLKWVLIIGIAVAVCFVLNLASAVLPAMLSLRHDIISSINTKR